jgi:hypothetical protein
MRSYFIILGLLLIWQVSHFNESKGCTVFYIKSDNAVFGGNNEDWKDPATMMFFYPATDSTYGWIKFGWASGFPQGGMNDQGLFWDGTAVTYLPMPVSEATKQKYDGPLMAKVITECANNTEARAIFNQYYCDDLYNAQYLLGDKHGSSMIVEGDSIIPIAGSFQVATNFYHSNPGLAGYPCRRYQTAYDMLNNMDDPGPFSVGSVLAATHQEGNYPTQYSNIYDLKNKVIYLFYYHNFEEFIEMDLVNELEKGYRSINIPPLYSRISLSAPAENATVDPASVTFSWYGIKENQYELLLSEDPDFPGYSSIKVHCNNSFDSNAGIELLTIVVIVLIAISFRRKKRLLFMLALIFPLLFNLNCKKDEDNINQDNLVELKETITGLESGTTYYWKVVAQKAGGGEFTTQTVTRSFQTSVQ